MSHFSLQLIVMLCIIDSLFAGFSFLEYGLKKGLKLISYTTPIYVNLWPKFLYPLHTITNTLSLFVTLAIAIERYSYFFKITFQPSQNFLSNRYIAICHPFLLQQERLKPNRSAAAQSQQSSTNGMSLKKRTCLYMLPVILISFLVNIPKFMEFRNTTRYFLCLVILFDLKIQILFLSIFINFCPLKMPTCCKMTFFLRFSNNVHNSLFQDESKRDESDIYRTDGDAIGSEIHYLLPQLDQGFSFGSIPLCSAFDPQWKNNSSIEEIRKYQFLSKGN